jgi:hypothetical protein
LCGINLIAGGTLAGILGPGQRFATHTKLTPYAGVAPLERPLRELCAIA